MGRHVWVGRHVRVRHGAGRHVLLGQRGLRHHVRARRHVTHRGPVARVLASRPGLGPALAPALGRPARPARVALGHAGVTGVARAHVRVLRHLLLHGPARPRHLAGARPGVLLVRAAVAGGEAARHLLARPRTHRVLAHAHTRHPASHRHSDIVH